MTRTSTAIGETASALTRRDLALALSTALTACRSTLRARGFVEVITPHLTPFAMEDARRAFAVRYLGSTVYLGQSRRRYLINLRLTVTTPAVWLAYLILLAAPLLAVLARTAPADALRTAPDPITPDP